MVALSALASVAFVSGVAVPSPAAAAPELDQQSAAIDEGSTYAANFGLAQTFTAGRTGALTKVAVGLRGTGAVTVSVTATTVAPAVPVGVPTGPALTFVRIPVGTAGWQEATFPTPIEVTAGTRYAITISKEADLSWFGADDLYPDGDFLYEAGGSWASLGWTGAFRTYVESSGGTDDPSAARPAIPVWTLGLNSAGGTCTQPQVRGADTSWLRLPDATMCTKADATLLGWSTSPTFPVTRARAQIARGWGAIDEVLDGSRVIFIPAGGATAATGENTLHAIWGSTSD
jgi:hypothetical protein